MQYFLMVEACGRLARQIRRWGAVPLLAVALLSLAPQPAEGQQILATCLDAVEGWYGDCYRSADNVLEVFGCKWVAGAGMILCVAASVIEHLALSIALPM